MITTHFDLLPLLLCRMRYRWNDHRYGGGDGSRPLVGQQPGLLDEGDRVPLDVPAHEHLCILCVVVLSRAR